MTVKEIVGQYLKDHGFDGLAGEDCGCGGDDLMCCCCSADSCEGCHAARLITPCSPECAALEKEGGGCDDAPEECRGCYREGKA
jgi:hypothetical protein